MNCRFWTGLLLAALPINAFFPNRLTSIDIGKDTLTHEDITQIGILKAVAHYFEDNPKPGNPISSGSLVEMNGISAAKLFKVYYGAEVNSNGLQEVINSIETHNSQAYADFMSKAVWHWNGELIREANGLLTSLRDAIIKELHQPKDEFDHAREMVGQYLHILQMFYSNTNWVEMFGPEAYYSLGIQGKPLYAQSTVQMMTCRNCGTKGDKSCNGTLIDNGQVLTSGYRSGQNMDKPNRDPALFKTGKCSHGGRFDSTSTTVAATGGINKDSTVESLSPHFYLHQQAVQAAINHTTFFFNNEVYGIRNLIDNEKYERFLQLKSGQYLVFVIDTTGSMSNDIAAVKQQIQKIITERLGTSGEPSSYGFALFNDPANLTTSFQTENSQEALNFVARIRADGGGDCPEYCMSGIETALKLSTPNSEILILTDASAKDYYKASLVSNLAKQKNAKLTFLLTGTCTSRRRRDTVQGLQHDGLFRSRRSLTGLDLYNSLASSTGGSVYQTTKGGISKLANIITEIAITSPVTILKREILPGSGDINIHVDNTITHLTLDITGRGILHEEIYNPDGNLQRLNLTTTDIGVGKLVKINSPAPGIWRLSGLNSSSWNVHITALSTLDISTKFVHLDRNTGFEFQIKGRPIAGLKATIILTIPSAESISSVDDIQLIDSHGSEIARYSDVSVIPGRANSSQYMYRIQFQLPTKQFQVAIWGKDASGNIFTRLQTRRIVPVAVGLEMMPVNDTLYINESVTVNCTVTNEGDAPSNITVTIEDDKHFAQKPLNHTFELGPRENATGIFILVAGPNPNVLVTATITATAKSSTGDNSQFEIIRLSTKKRIHRPTDNESPVCNITSMTGICDETMVDPCVCSQYNWTATAEIWDTGFGLYQITSSVKGNEKFTLEAFTEGQTIDNGTVKAIVSGNCCNQVTYINVVDMASNTGQCEINPSPGIEITSTECKPEPNNHKFPQTTLTIIAVVAGSCAVIVVIIIVAIACVVTRSRRPKMLDSPRRRK